MSLFDKNEPLLTFRQQAERLRTWNKIQLQCLSSSDDNVQNKDGRAPNINVTDSDSSCEQICKLDDIPESDSLAKEITIVDVDSNNGNCPNDDNTGNITTQYTRRPKQKYLKRGEGLARFRITNDFYKRKNKINKLTKVNPNTIKSIRNKETDDVRNTVVKFYSRNNENEQPGNTKEDHDKIVKANFNPACNSATINPEEVIEDRFSNKKDSDDLKLFEMLEEKANNSSFSSTSSLIRKLMEESFKSTPIKNKINLTSNDQNKPSLEVDNSFADDYDDDSEQSPILQDDYIDCEILRKKFLEIIEEEPSKLDLTIDDRSRTQNDMYHSIYNKYDIRTEDYNTNNSDDEVLHSWDDANNKTSSSIGSCTCSDCSCIEETSHFVSTSLSIIAEEKSIYSSPCKKYHRLETNSVGYDNNSGSGHVRTNYATTKDSNVSAELLENISDLTLLETNEDNAALKLLLRSRLQELEQEIEAFKLETSIVNRLRRSYDDEYKKFLTEKEEFLKKIRQERQKEIELFVEEKKKFHREKMIFDRCVKGTKNMPSKVERAEIVKLKSEIVNLKTEMNQKTSRWGAAQARIRTQMKQLENHNNELKEEIEKLRKSSASKKTITNIKSKKMSNQENRNYSNNVDSTTTNLNTTSNHVDSSQNKENMSDFTVSRIITQSPVYDNYERFLRDIYNFEDEKEFLSNSEHYHKDDFSYDNSDLSTTFPQDTFIKADATNRDSLKEIRSKTTVDGSKEIWYANGNVKKISADGKLMKTIYYNGDVKEVSLDDNIVKYYHSLNRTWHTTFNDGLEITEFSDGQLEKRYKDGTVEVVYPNDMFCIISPTGEEKWQYSDGTIVINDKINNEKIIILPNKQKEIHNKNYKKREYPDGTVKIMYIDGLQETRYSNGRIRLKNKDGVLISDSEIM